MLRRLRRRCRSRVPVLRSNRATCLYLTCSSYEGDSRTLCMYIYITNDTVVIVSLSATRLVDRVNSEMFILDASTIHAFG